MREQCGQHPWAPHRPGLEGLTLVTIDPGPNRGSATHSRVVVVVAASGGDGAPELSSSLPDFRPLQSPPPCPMCPRGLSAESKETKYRDPKSLIKFNVSYRRKLHGHIQDEHCSLASLCTRRASLVQKAKSQDTSAATPPGSNLS